MRAFGPAEGGCVVLAVRGEPLVNFADGGSVTFTPPIPAAVRREFDGHSVDVDVEGLRFSVVIGEDIPLPLNCASFREAKDIVMSVSIQIMSALLQSRQAGQVTKSREPAAAPRPVAAATPASVVVLHRPNPIPVPAPERDRGETTFAALFAAWSRYHLSTGGAPTTPPYWQVLITRFATFLGHDRPADVTSHDIRAYRDHLIASGRRLRTARHSDFAALRAIYHFGVENELVPTNPTIGVKFKADRLAAAESMSAFSSDEARAILAAADRQTIPSRRWIPWLTAMTGSRVAAIANLRKQDVIEVEGVWCLRISRQAGPIKTAASERIVPIHPAILARGFLAFVEKTQRERLFFGESDGAVPGSGSNPPVGQGARPYNPARSTIRRVTEWLHGLGLEIGRAAKKDPNHAWRHWFKEQAFAAGIPEKITDAIVGHAQATTSRRYGAVSIAAMEAELRKIRPPV